MNAQAQAESLIAERKNVQITLDVKATRWEAALHQVTELGEEAVEQERTNRIEAEIETTIFASSSRSPKRNCGIG